MELKHFIAKALNAKGGFELIDGERTTQPDFSFDYEPYRGKYVFWKLQNTAHSVWNLLQAMHNGVVPIILPGRVPEAKYSELLATYSGFAEWTGRGINRQAELVPADPDVMFVIATSGSTGDPKLIAAGEENLVRAIRAIHDRQDLAPCNNTGITLPVSYVYAFINQLLWSILYERKLIFCGNILSPADMFCLFRKNNIEMLCFVASQMRVLVKLGFKEIVRSVKCVNFAGEFFPFELMENIRTMFPSAYINNNFGCTEAMPRITVYRVTDQLQDAKLVGAPLKTLKIRIAGEMMHGPIEIKGTSVALGKIQTDGSLRRYPEWIPTGNVGYIRDSKLYLLGRNDQVIKIRGERFSLAECEKALIKCGLTNAVAWVEESGNARDVRCVVCSKTSPDGKMLRRRLRAYLPSSVIPSAIFWTQHCKSTASEKISRRELILLARKNALKRIC